MSNNKPVSYLYNHKGYLFFYSYPIIGDKTHYDIIDVYSANGSILIGRIIQSVNGHSKWLVTASRIIDINTKDGNMYDESYHYFPEFNSPAEAIAALVNPIIEAYEQYKKVLGVKDEVPSH